MTVVLPDKSLIIVLFYAFSWTPEAANRFANGLRQGWSGPDSRWLTTAPSKPSAIAAHEGGPAGALRPDHEA
jgi:hypothetical protein